MMDLTIDGETFAVAVTGDPTRPALMLSHALGTNHRMWDGQAALLEKHFRMVRYDTRGHGGSALGGKPLSIARLGRDALAILDALDIPRTHWLGLSMGGAVGLWLLANAPERIDRAIIASSAPRLGTPDGWNTRIMSVHAHGMADVADATLERWFSPSFAEREPSQVAKIRDMLQAMEPASYAAACSALRDTDLHAELAGINHDVLVISGRDDQTVTTATAEALAATLKGGRLVELDARHLSNIEAEADFNAAVVAFLTTKRMPRSKPPASAGVTKSGTAKNVAPVRGSARRRSNAARNPLKEAAPKVSPTKAGGARPAAKTASARRQRPSKRTSAVSATPAAAKAPVRQSSASKTRTTKAPAKTSGTARSSVAKPSGAQAPARKAGMGKTGRVKTVGGKTVRSKTVSRKASSKSTRAKALPARGKAAVAKSRKASDKGAAAKAKPSLKRPTPAKKAVKTSAKARSGAKAKTAAKAKIVATAKTGAKANTAVRTKPPVKAKTVARPKTVTRPKIVTKPKPASAAGRKPAKKPRRPAGRRKP